MLTPSAVDMKFGLLKLLLSTCLLLALTRSLSLSMIHWKRGFQSRLVRQIDAGEVSMYEVGTWLIYTIIMVLDSRGQHTWILTVLYTLTVDRHASAWCRGPP